jgi:hypothetical protein
VSKPDFRVVKVQSGTEVFVYKEKASMHGKMDEANR